MLRRTSQDFCATPLQLHAADSLPAPGSSRSMTNFGMAISFALRWMGEQTMVRNPPKRHDDDSELHARNSRRRQRWRSRCRAAGRRAGPYPSRKCRVPARRVFAALGLRLHRRGDPVPDRAARCPAPGAVSRRGGRRILHHAGQRRERPMRGPATRSCCPIATSTPWDTRKMRRRCPSPRCFRCRHGARCRWCGTAAAASARASCAATCTAMTCCSTPYCKRCRD